MRWKWLFFGLLAAGVGLVWNNDYEKSRRELVSELNGARELVNKMAKPYEAWQIIFISVGLTLLVTSLYSFLFREDQPLFARFKKSAFAVIRTQQKIRTRSMHDRFVKFKSYYYQITMVAKKHRPKHRLGLETDHVHAN